MVVNGWVAWGPTSAGGAEGSRRTTSLASCQISIQEGDEMKRLHLGALAAIDSQKQAPFIE